MPRYTLHVNGRTQTLDVPADTPLLWVLREDLKLTGTKFGCGIGICRACTVHLDGAAAPSCQMTVAQADGHKITTIEGLETTEAKALQQAWIDLDVPQCGYCQSGQIMTAAALLKDEAHPTDADVKSAMSANLCRCGTYNRIRAAIHRASDTLASSEPSPGGSQ